MNATNITKTSVDETTSCQEDKAMALTLYLVFFTLFFFITCIVIAFIKRRQERHFPPLAAARSATTDATAAPGQGSAGAGQEGGRHLRSYSAPTFATAALFHNVGVTSPVLIPPPYSSIAFDTSVLIVSSDMPPSYSEADDSHPGVA